MPRTRVASATLVTAIRNAASRSVVEAKDSFITSRLPPVAAKFLGYLAGGLVVIETVFHYRGIGALIYTAARAKDFPMLEAGVLTVGAVYAVACGNTTVCVSACGRLKLPPSVWQSL